MRLFTSAFKKNRNKKFAQAFTLFVFFFSAHLALGVWVNLFNPEWIKKPFSLPLKFQNLDSFSQFEAYGQLDTPSALYWGIGPMISLAQKADVLMVGNSRPYFAFRDEFIENAEKKSGLRFFNLVGARMNVLFTREIIVRNNLRPRFIIVNEDDFFYPILWPFQKDVMTRSWWNVWSNIQKSYFFWIGNRYLRKMVPELTFFNPNSGNYKASYNSPLNNFLYKENLSGDHHPLTESSNKRSLDLAALEMAKRFIEEMKRRGSQVVLTSVPDGQNMDYIQEESTLLGVPYVLEKLENLETFDLAHYTVARSGSFRRTFYDGMHLTPESSKRFASAFFADFFRLPQVAEYIQIKRIHDP